MQADYNVLCNVLVCINLRCIVLCVHVVLASLAQDLRLLLISLALLPCRPQLHRPSRPTSPQYSEWPPPACSVALESVESMPPKGAGTSTSAFALGTLKEGAEVLWRRSS